MSQSPVDGGDQSERARYLAGWNALNTMLGRGGSFSGRERNCAFLNCGVAGPSQTPRFANVSGLSGFDFPDDARGVALVDWDHDGDLDLWVSNRTAPRLRYLDNRLGSEGDSVALLLQGVTCNRDAIGARVEVDTSRGIVTRTSRAGDGYLSQSSKWLHIGLGADGGVDALQVHWPGGGTESFSGVAAGGRYILTQGSGEAEAWSRPGAMAELKTVPNLAAPGVSSVAQVLLPRRIPTPRLVYTSDVGSMQIEPGGQPLLLVFFASWCPNCKAELGELAASADPIRAAGIEVLALSVDSLQDGGSDAQAAELLNNLGWPFAAGSATAELLAKLGHLTDALFELRTPFAVPYSMLLDPGRDLVAIYRGPIPLETLEFDAGSSTAAIEVTRDLAVPFAGKWYTQHPGRPALLELLADHFQQAYPDEALRFLEMALPQLAEQAAAAVCARMVGLRINLADRAMAANDSAGAEAQFRALLALGEESARLHHDLGIALFNQGKLKAAEAAFQRSLELAPGNPSATRNLQTVRGALSGR